MNKHFLTSTLLGQIVQTTNDAQVLKPEDSQAIGTIGKQIAPNYFYSPTSCLPKKSAATYPLTLTDKTNAA